MAPRPRYERRVIASGIRIDDERETWTVFPGVLLVTDTTDGDPVAYYELPRARAVLYPFELEAARRTGGLALTFGRA
jgi:hypothetical protein